MTACVGESLVLLYHFSSFLLLLIVYSHCCDISFSPLCTGGPAGTWSFSAVRRLLVGDVAESASRRGQRGSSARRFILHGTADALACGEAAHRVSGEKEFQDTTSRNLNSKIDSRLKAH